MQTGAATAVAAKYMANPESKTIGILSCYFQGRMDLRAITITIPALEAVKAHDISDNAASENARAQVMIK